MFRATGPGKVDFKDRSVWGVRNDCTALVYNFDVEGDKLKDDHRKFLRATIVPRLKAGCGVTIMGLADATGDASYNQALSERRAHELLAFLRIEAGGAFPLRAEVGRGKDVAVEITGKDHFENEYYRGVALSVWDKTPPPPPIKPVPPETLPASGVKVTNTWRFVASAGFDGRGVTLTNGVWLPLPARGRTWPNRATSAVVSRTIDSNGIKHYQVRLLTLTDENTPQAVRKGDVFIQNKVKTIGVSQAAKGILRGPGMKINPALNGAGSGALGVLVPTNDSAEKIWQLHCTEGSETVTVDGITSF